MLTHADVSSGFTPVLLFMELTYLMAEKVRDWNGLTDIDEETIRLREEINLQYQALGEVVKLG